MKTQFYHHSRGVVLATIGSLVGCAYVSADDDAVHVVDDNILLVVNYQHAEWYGTMGLLEKLYRPYFPSMIFFGRQPHENTLTYEHHRGWQFEYTSIAHAMKTSPHYKGYLWINDDLIINPWNFYRFDKQKLWMSKPSNMHVDLSLGTSAVRGWMWWPMKLGYEAFRHVYEELDVRYVETLKNNCGPHHGIYGYSDIVYIPARYRDDFIALSALCDKHGLFLEIALPFICSCIAPFDEWEVFNGRDLWSGSDRSRALQIYDGTMDFIHPIKISKPECQDVVKTQFRSATQCEARG